MQEKQAQQTGLNQQNVAEGISPIYQPLQPDWNESATILRPLVARGDFSNAWVVYDEAELPPKVDRPSALKSTKPAQQPPK